LKKFIIKEISKWERLNDDLLSYEISKGKFALLSYNYNLKLWISGFPNPKNEKKVVFVKEKDLEIAKMKVCLLSF
tara:strand:+ start:578 stop:802 length:225 start_codon:yes stop_codon:yes gene_type:complete